MESQPLLSIVMPCFNAEETLQRALDSILMQKTDFEYEILIVNDGSTDKTLGIIQSNAAKHSQIHLIQHERNLGNANSTYDGLCAAQGDYFCILDGDDYYTHCEKLQRQIDFFRNDTLHEYIASVHYFIFDLNNGTFSMVNRTTETEYNYIDYILQKTIYFHTATYMFRNVFRDNVPGYLKFDKFSGDTPLVFFLLRFSQKKTKILDFVGSAYVYSLQGIWSSMSRAKQKEYQIGMLENLKAMTDTDFEKESLDKWINQVETWSYDDNVFGLPSSIEFLVRSLHEYNHRLSQQLNNFSQNRVFYSQYVDSLCASLGFITRLENPECILSAVKDNHIAIIVSQITSSDADLLGDISNIIEKHRNEAVKLFITDLVDEEIEEGVQQVFTSFNNLSVVLLPYACSERLRQLCIKLAEFAPSRAYFLTSSNDTYAQALLQAGLCQNIAVLSLGNAYSSGITNPNLDLTITGQQLDNYILALDDDFSSFQVVNAIGSSLTESRLFEGLYGEEGKLDLLKNKYQELRLAEKAIKRETDAYQIIQIKRSTSYRAGQLCAQIPRFIVEFTQDSFKHGFKQAVQIKTSKVKERYFELLDPSEALRRVNESVTWRVGQVLTMPYRSLYQKPLLPVSKKPIKLQFQDQQQISIIDQNWIECFQRIALNEQWQDSIQVLSKTSEIAFFRLYTVYRAIQYVKPKRVLVIGISSETILFENYVKMNKDALCMLVDIDSESLSKYDDMSGFVTIPLTSSEEISQSFVNNSFDLVLINSLGCDGKASQLLEEVYPSLIDSIQKDYVIILSGLNHSLFQRITENISDSLNTAGLLSFTIRYSFENEYFIWCSGCYSNILLN